MQIKYHNKRLAQRRIFYLIKIYVTVTIIAGVNDLPTPNSMHHFM